MQICVTIENAWPLRTNCRDEIHEGVLGRPMGGPGRLLRGEGATSGTSVVALEGSQVGLWEGQQIVREPVF